MMMQKIEADAFMRELDGSLTMHEIDGIECPLSDFATGVGVGFGAGVAIGIALFLVC